MTDRPDAPMPWFAVVVIGCCVLLAAAGLVDWAARELWRSTR